MPGASQRVALRCLQGALEEALVEEMHLLTVVLGHEVLQTSVQPDNGRDFQSSSLISRLPSILSGTLKS